MVIKDSQIGIGDMPGRTRVDQGSNQSITEATYGIFRGFQPKSGVQFIYSPPNSFFTAPPNPLVAMTDDQITGYVKSVFGEQTNTLSGLTREQVNEEVNYSIVGGCGITARDIHKARRILPQIDDLLQNAGGKVVILGNGYSTLPLHAASLYARGILKESPVIGELYDYPDLRDDFETLQERFSHSGLRYPYGMELARVTDIVEAINIGILDAIKYPVGSGNPPPALMNASLVINLYGPPRQTVQEQLSMLRQGGKLASSEDYSGVAFGPGFILSPVPKLDLDIDGNASLIEKLS